MKRLFSTNASSSKLPKQTFKQPLRPNYEELLPKNRHHLSQLIDEDSPFIFMNQKAYLNKENSTIKSELHPDMQQNFFNAYKHFLATLSDYTQSLHIKNSFFAKNKFTLSLDEDLDLETETLKENLQTMCEGSFFEEIEESLIQGLHQSQSELQMLNLKYESDSEEHEGEDQV